MAILKSVGRKLRKLELFAGAGGGILAGELLGMQTVCAVEIESFRCERLADRQNEGLLPPFPIWNGPIQQFDGRPWRGLVDVVSLGFPCQDISAANPNAVGITGERSGLWKEGKRIICEVGPEYVLVENSPMLARRGLGVVLGDLAEMGYDAKWGVLGADNIGGYHERKRMFIVANHPGKRTQSEQVEGIQEGGSISPIGSGGVRQLGNSDCAGLEKREGISGDAEPQQQTTWGASAGAMANTRHEQARRSSEPIRAEEKGPSSQPSGLSSIMADSNGSLCDRGSEMPRREKEQRITPDGSGPDCLWRNIELIECRDGKIRATKPGLCGMAYGVADRVERISAIGDGQVPAVVAAMWQILNKEI